MPEQMDFEGKKVVEVAAGYCFYLVVTEDGALYSFGFNDKGQLGLGHRYSQEKPHRIQALADHHIVTAVAGQQHSVALTDKGLVISWGGGVFGLGHGDGSDLLEPRIVQALAGKKVEQMACGTYHTFLVTDGGEIYSFGHGEYGQQGTGDLGERGEQTRNALLPRKLERIPWNSLIRSIHCGHLHTLFILEDGTIWTCGWGTAGVLGHGDQKYRLNPTQVKALEGDAIISAAGGWKHNLAIKAGSTTFALDFEKREDLFFLSFFFLLGLQVHTSSCFDTVVLTSPKNPDITFIVDRKPIYAHRAIVCHRCPKIKAMVTFSGNRFNRSQQSLEVAVKNTRFVVFKAMINFLYTDHLNVAPFFAPEVAALAARFNLPRLVGLARQLTLGPRKEEGQQLPPSTFSQDLFDLLDQPKYSDITFRFDSPPTEYYGHKMVLTARCPYFHTLFEGGHFKDSGDGVINMSHCPVSQLVFLLAMQYIYTGDREIVTTDTALELLAGADYFLLDDLKRICEDVIEKNMERDQETLEVILESSDLYGAKRLAHFCRLNLEGIQVS